MRKQIYASLFVMILFSATLAQTAQQSSMVIRGQVLDDRGHPVSGAVVNAHPDGGLKGKLPSATSDVRGEFTIVVSQTGSFKVWASKPADGYPSPWNPFYYPTEDNLARVVVSENHAAPFATVSIGTKAGKIAGRIVDAVTERPVTDANIDLCRAGIPKYCHRVFAKHPNGQFDILVPSTPFTIRVSASGYKDWSGVEGENWQPMSLEVVSGAIKMASVLLEKLSARGGVIKPSVMEAPQILSPSNGAEFYHLPRTTKLEWSAVPGAVSYTVELEFCQPVGADKQECPGYLLQLRGNPPLSGIEGTTYEFLFIGTQTGRWRVWAVDAKGRMGTKSAWSIFIYRL